MQVYISNKCQFDYSFGNSEQRLATAKFFKLQFKDDHYKATPRFTQDVKTFLVKLHEIIMELTEMNNAVLSHLDENFDLKEIYVYITFYFDGKVEFNGIGLDKGM